ncbi:divalent metal cation transporter [Pontibacter sp. G13]|uniref:NRAMP family divalent metal transporter n=1 Tax=Pontibacter sp. G13 TaxID=3074898 RepID=UPI00288B5EB2|nr:divalent metal cation transporter [Pontibacter sp. G13]WNJ21341.1 divalent metal cation transporter [Pontibacter sp. G13]
MKGRYLISILFWSVISAAFIGPGTVTTAAKSGASFGTSLLWALGFSTIACIFLQEAAARLNLATGAGLGAAIRKELGHPIWAYLTFLTIFSGGIAFQAGNMLGAVAGIELLLPNSQLISVLLIGGIAFGMLWSGTPSNIAKWLGAIVGIMGVVFLLVVFSLPLAFSEVIRGAFIPSIPSGSESLVLGLIGTTIVPYNLFLGSELRNQSPLSVMRIGLATAVLIGGLISGAILLVGTQISGDFSFAALAEVLSQSLGPWARWFFALGLLIAGFTSSVTAPLATALTARSLFQVEGKEDWESTSGKFKLIWGIVLIVGLGFGMSNVKPIPLIIIAQTLNGLLLPFITSLLVILVNHPTLMPDQMRNGLWSNFILLAINGVMCFLSLFKVWGILAPESWVDAPSSQIGFVLLAVLIQAGLAWRIHQSKKRLAE